MATGLQKWSTTAASNNTADSAVNWAEGMAPSAVNDSARAMMAAAAKWRDDNNGTLVTTGSTTAFTVTSNQVSTGNVDGYTVSVKFHATADTSASLAVDGNTAAKLQLTAGTNLTGGEFQTGTIAQFRYDSGSTAWICKGYGGPANSANIADGSITYAKIQNVTQSRLLGSFSTSTATSTTVGEISIGTGLQVTSNTLSAPAFPPQSAYKNLSVKVTGNSSATLAADYVTLATSGSTSFVTLPLSANVNLGASGSANQLDTGSLASGTWYAMWAIATTTSTAAQGLASTSYTTPVMPSGYTLKARVGAIVTSTSTSAQQLKGTWQYGRKAQYVVGLAQTSGLPLVISGASGDVSTPTFTSASLSNFVPTTASVAHFVARTGGTLLTAPSTSYGTATSTTAPPPITGAGTWAFTLEGSNIYYASNASGGAIHTFGWEDNI